MDALASILTSRLDGTLEGAPTVRWARVVTDPRAPVGPGDLFIGLAGPRHDGSRSAGAALAAGSGHRRGRRRQCPDPARSRPGGDPGGRSRESPSAARPERTGSPPGVVVAVAGWTDPWAARDALVEALDGSLRVSAPVAPTDTTAGVSQALLDADPAAQVVVVVVPCASDCASGDTERRALIRPDLGILVDLGPDPDPDARAAADIATLFADAQRVFVPSSGTRGTGALAPIPVHVVPTGVHADPRGLAIAVARHLTADHLDDDRSRQHRMRLVESTTPDGRFLLHHAGGDDGLDIVAALAVLGREPGRRIVVLAGADPSPRPGLVRVARTRRAVVANDVHALLMVGPDPDALVGMLEESVPVVSRVPDVAAAASWLAEHTEAGDRILLEGLAFEGFDDLSAALFDTLPPAVLTVSLDTIVDNFHRHSRAAGVPVMPVVKASAYGIDQTRVALALQRAGTQHFVTAYPEEGAQLRAAGIRRPILVQNVVPTEIAKSVAASLSIQVATRTLIEAVGIEAARQSRLTKVHLKVESGMGRAGCSPADAPSLIARIRRHRWLQLDGLMTHFAASDDPASDAFTRSQIQAFDGALPPPSDRPTWVHASNSAAIARFPDAAYSAVRAGLGLYGYSRVDERVQTGPRPSLTLTTRVVSTRAVPPGKSVGYGRTWIAPEARTLAIVALGYADGYPLGLSNRGWMSVRGIRCPVVGRVCMDVTMIDITGIPDVGPGESVVVFGPGPDTPDLIELASAAHTIPYEMITRLGKRIRRVFEHSH